MKILVCISNVPDTTSKINFKDNDTQFDTNGVQYIINPNDEFGLTKAVQLKEQQGASITVANVGELDAEPTLRKALAIGADEAIRVNAQPANGLFVAEQLAKVIQEGSYDLVIMGKESIDYNGGMVGGMTAALTDLPFVDKCVGLQIDGSSATAEREIDGGKEKVSVSLPVIVAGQKGLVEEKDLRIPNMRGIMMARKKALNVMEPEGVSVSTEVVKFEKPAAKPPVKMVSPEDLDQLIDLLHNEAKVI